MKRSLLASRILLLWLASMTVAAAAPSPEETAAAYALRTLVLYNSTLPKSKELAEYYAEKRGIPAKNLIGLKCSAQETISRTEFNSTIYEPLRTHFTEQKWWLLEQKGPNKISTKVTHRIFAIMQGIPMRINEEPEYGPPDPKTKERPVIPPPAGKANAASVDSELTIFGVVDHAITGPLNNAYYDKTTPFLSEALAPFFIVGRIDGPSYEIAKRLIDDALAIEKIGLYGKVYIDLAQKNDAGYKEGEDWLLASAKTFGASGFPLIVDTRPQTFLPNYPMTDAAVYLGWYVIPPDGPFLNPNFKFKRGAVACHLHSFSATTVRATNEGWVGLLLSQGACGVLGNVFEPFLGLTVHFDKLSDRLLRGFCLAEAASMATPGCSWMNVVLGDPLYRPFAAEIDKGTTDPEYRLLRQSMRDEPPTPGGNPKLFSKLEKAAAGAKSGTLYEALSQIAQGSTPDDAARIAKYFSAANDNYKLPADQIRNLLQQAEYLTINNKKEAAIKLLKGGLSHFAKEPEVKAIETRLGELQPKQP
jgi:uncharacterized protein (TIGR03790 family)